MSKGIIILSNRKVNQFHLKYNKSQLIIESGCHQQKERARFISATPPNKFPYQAADIYSPVHRALDKLFTSIWLTAIKRIDLENITAASGSSKFRGSVNKAERKKKFVKHGHLLPESEAKAQGNQ